MYYERLFNETKRVYEETIKRINELISELRKLKLSPHMRDFVEGQIKFYEDLIAEINSQLPNRGFIETEDLYEDRIVPGFSIPSIQDVSKGGFFDTAIRNIRKYFTNSPFTPDENTNNIQPILEVFQDVYRRLDEAASDFHKASQLLEEQYTERETEHQEELHQLFQDGDAPNIEKSKRMKEFALTSSVTQRYVPASWDVRRALTDICQNHLPSDSGGTFALITFRTKDGVWHELPEMVFFTDDEIDRIRIEDDGKGFDPNNLIYFNPTKGDESAGKWGEGLKMAIASAMRNGMKVVLHSRLEEPVHEINSERSQIMEWVASPFYKDIMIGNNFSQALSYNIVSIGPNDAHDDSHGSSTTFIDPSFDFIRAVRDIGQSILYFSDRQPILENDDIALLEIPNDGERGSLFIKGLRVPTETKLLFSYNLKRFDIQTRDRDHIDVTELEYYIGQFLSSLTDKELIKKIIMKSEEFVREQLPFTVEMFSDMDTFTSDEAKLAWITAFKELYGEKMAVRSIANLDFNAVHQANHLGLDVVTLPHTLATFLQTIEGPNGEKIVSYESALSEAIENASYIPEEELTDDERIVIKFLLEKVSPLLLDDNGEKRVKHIRVYNYEEGYSGTQAAGFASQGDTISIDRESFHNIKLLFHVFFHESDHAFTGAEDADKAFRDFLTKAMASWAGRELLGTKANEIPSLASVFVTGAGQVESNGYNVKTPSNKSSEEIVPPGGWVDDDVSQGVVVSYGENPIIEGMPDPLDDDIAEEVPNSDGVHPIDFIEEDDDALWESLSQPEKVSTSFSELGLFAAILRSQEFAEGQSEHDTDGQDIMTVLEGMVRTGHSLAEIKKAIEMMEHRRGGDIGGQ